MFEFLRKPIRKSFARKFGDTYSISALAACQYMLSSGILFTLISFVVMLIVRQQWMEYWEPVFFPLMLSAYFLLLRAVFLPRISRRWHIDLIAAGIFAPILGHFFVISHLDLGKDMMTGTVALLLVSGIVFRSSGFYFVFAGVTLVGWHGASIVGWTQKLDLNQLLLLYLMGPLLVLVVRLSWVKSLDRLSKLGTRRSRATQRLRQSVRDLHDEQARRRESERKLANAQKQESLGSLASGVAHEFNNFLLGIISLSETIELESAEPATKKSAQQIRDVANSAADVCRQMLAYAGCAEHEMKILDLGDTIRNMERLLSSVVTPRNKLWVELGPERLFVKADQTQLRQVVLNLVANANQSIDSECGNVLVETAVLKPGDEQDPEFRQFGELQPADEYALIAVEDDGKGIRESELGRIFDPFYSDKELGNGLGLSVTLGIAKAHGGALRCRTARGQGTRMELLLPQVRQLQEPAAAPVPEQCHVRGATVLIVDDEPLLLQNLARLLELKGWKVLATDRGEQAVEWLAQGEDVQACILDFAMPGMDGLETLRRIRDLGLDVPVLLSSGFVADSLDCNAQPPNAFIQKPYRINELVRKLNELLVDDPKANAVTATR